jgi:predicted enzyme related to lactoylglutathione lyase
MLNFNSILIGSEHPEKLREFYKKILGKKPDMDQGGYFGFLVGSAFISFGPHDKVKGKSKNPERMLFNFETKDVKGEFERIKKLGAHVVAAPYKMGEMPGWIATFADPDGNYFQLLPPWEDEKK